MPGVCKPASGAMVPFLSNLAEEERSRTVTRDTSGPFEPGKGYCLAPGPAHHHPPAATYHSRPRPPRTRTLSSDRPCVEVGRRSWFVRRGIAVSNPAPYL
jgi:hypothetical protein